jgi:hypothetical protein
MAPISVINIRCYSCRRDIISTCIKYIEIAECRIAADISIIRNCIAFRHCFSRQFYNLITSLKLRSQFSDYTIHTNFLIYRSKRIIKQNYIMYWVQIPVFVIKYNRSHNHLRALIDPSKFKTKIYKGQCKDRSVNCPNQESRIRFYKNL